MIERLKTDAPYRHIDPQQTLIAHTVGAVYETLGIVDEVAARAYKAQRAGQRLLEQILPEGVNRITLNPDDFGTFDRFCRTIGYIGRKPHRDPTEANGTTHKVADVIGATHESQPVYIKTGKRTFNPNTATHVMGTIVGGTTVEVVRGRGVVLSIRTPHVRKGTQTTEVPVDVIAAGLEPRGGRDTGVDTPMLVVGQQDVRGIVDEALLSPRRERNAHGIDPADIFMAMCAGGMHFEDLGYTKEEIMRIRHRVIAGIGRTCREGATYSERVTMLLPSCDSRDEAMGHIDAAIKLSDGRQLHPDFEREHQYLLSLQPA